MRATRNFYFLIAGVAVCSVVLFLLILLQWMNVNWQALEDARELKAANFTIRGHESPGGWLADLERHCFSDDPPRRWKEIYSPEFRSKVTPEQLAAILKRQRRLESVTLPTHCVDEEVLHQLTKQRRLEDVYIWGSHSIDEVWVQSLTEPLPWKSLNFDAPGLSPASVMKILHHTRELESLSLCDDAIDDTVADAILARKFRRLGVYFGSQSHSPAAIRLVENFAGEEVFVSGSEDPLNYRNFPHLRIDWKRLSKLECFNLPQIEVHHALNLSTHRCDQVTLRDAEKSAAIEDCELLVVADSPLLERIEFSAERAQISNCTKLQSITVSDRLYTSLTLENLPALRRYAQDSPGSAMIPQLLKCPSLFSVQLSIQSSTSRDSIEPLAALPNLQTLVLRFDSNFSHPWFAEIEKLPHLKNLILLQMYHAEEIEPDWSSFHARLPPGFQRVIICSNPGPDVTRLETWKAMANRYAKDGIQFEAFANSPFEVPAEFETLLTGP